MKSLWTTIKSSPSSLQLEEAQTKQWRHSTAKKKLTVVFQSHGNMPWDPSCFYPYLNLHSSFTTHSLGLSTPTTVHLSFTTFSLLHLKCFPSPSAYTPTSTSQSNSSSSFWFHLKLYFLGKVFPNPLPSLRLIQVPLVKWSYSASFPHSP